MSVITRSTVSTAPDSTSARSSSSDSGIGYSYTPGGMDRKRPVIGVSAYDVPLTLRRWRDFQSVVAAAGSPGSVLAAGGMRVVTPPVDGSTELLDLLDG